MAKARGEDGSIIDLAQDSIEISKSTKGVFTYSAKVYYHGDEDFEATKERLVNIDKWFGEKFEKREEE